MSDTVYVMISLMLIIVAQFLGNRESDKRKFGEFERLCGIAEEAQILVERSIEKHDAEREVWRIERQQLLDRIQAPSFDHLKHHEVQVIKAKNKEKEPESLEVL